MQGLRKHSKSGEARALRGTLTSKKGQYVNWKGYFTYKFVKSGGYVPPVPPGSYVHDCMYARFVSSGCGNLNCLYVVSIYRLIHDSWWADNLFVAISCSKHILDICFWWLYRMVVAINCWVFLLTYGHGLFLKGGYWKAVLSIWFSVLY